MFQKMGRAFVSHSLSKAERNYNQIVKDALALVFGVKKFHKYLFGRRFTLLTDHKLLLFILNSKSSLPPISAAGIHRWAFFLSTYDYSVEYKNTKANANADSLSQLPMEGQEGDMVDSMLKVSLFDGLPLLTAADIVGETVEDPILSHVYQHVFGD